MVVPEPTQTFDFGRFTTDFYPHSAIVQGADTNDVARVLGAFGHPGAGVAAASVKVLLSAAPSLAIPPGVFSLTQFGSSNAPSAWNLPIDVSTGIVAQLQNTEYVPIASAVEIHAGQHLPVNLIFSCSSNAPDAIGISFTMPPGTSPMEGWQFLRSLYGPHFDVVTTKMMVDYQGMQRDKALKGFRQRGGDWVTEHGKILLSPLRDTWCKGWCLESVHVAGPTPEQQRAIANQSNSLLLKDALLSGFVDAGGRFLQRPTRTNLVNFGGEICAHDFLVDEGPIVLVRHRHTIKKTGDTTSGHPTLELYDDRTCDDKELQSAYVGVSNSTAGIIVEGHHYAWSSSALERGNPPADNGSPFLSWRFRTDNSVAAEKRRIAITESILRSLDAGGSREPIASVLNSPKLFARTSTGPLNVGDRLTVEVRGAAPIVLGFRYVGDPYERPPRVEPECLRPPPLSPKG